MRAGASTTGVAGIACPGGGPAGARLQALTAVAIASSTVPLIMIALFDTMGGAQDSSSAARRAAANRDERAPAITSGTKRTRRRSAREMLPEVYDELRKLASTRMGAIAVA